MSSPSVPPRPQRSQAGPTAVKNDTPIIPPRPARKTDLSPDREAYTRSPLNNPPTALNNSRQTRPRTSQDLPRRPPSVSLPDVGHEGEEYSSFDQLPDEAHGVSSKDSGEQTRNVSADLPMHQPKASVPQATAKRQIQTVTGTDSTQAAAAGIGRSRPADDVHKLPPADAGHGSPLSRVTSGGEPRPSPSTEPHNLLRTRASFNRSTSSLVPLERTTSRPASIHGDDREYGIPEIGKQVPLLQMAGDVQAPTPGGGSSQHTPGVGFFNDGSSRSQQRKRNSRQEYGPPDSYGLHHDYQDQFEKEWVRKHPQEAQKEEFYHHLPKPETAMSSEQLNRLVHADDSITTSTGTPGTPDEHTADEYLSRYSSAATSPAPDAKGREKPESPLRKSGFPFNEKKSLHSADALTDDEHEHEHEQADGTPILAADEIIKRPGSAFMHAAVVADPDSHHDDYYYDSDTGRNSRRSSVQGTSRPSSRPSSVHGTSGLQGYHGGALRRYVSHEEQTHSGMGTPLEEIEEYEPLFGEDDGKEVQKRIFKKRPELAQHHFPSQDVWEDTPSSLQYSTTVSTPDLEHTGQESLQSGSVASTFETPEQEAQRRYKNDKENNMRSDNKTFVKPVFKSGVSQEMHRPGAHRFPSSDVWEDSPDSFSLVTTVNGPQDDERAPDDTRPAIPSRPQRKTKLSAEVKPPEEDDQRETRVKSPPVPAKPTIPTRPARPAKAEQLEGGEQTDAVKSKPPVPARPAGEKIAALKAGFMHDLNNRLKLGPQGPPSKKEPEAEAEEEVKAPLVDARKSRAKGPARRKPAAAPVADRKSSITFAFSPLIHCWSIDEEDELQVHEREEKSNKEAQFASEVEKVLAENEQNNVDSAAPAADIASQVSSATAPGKIAGQHLSSEGELKAALAGAGAAPSSFGDGEAKADPAASGESAASEKKDTSVQTGETELTTTLPSGDQEKVTAYLGAKVPGEGNVVVKDSEAQL